jgi:hypothetical protein
MRVRSEVAQVEMIASGSQVRDRTRLDRAYGRAFWRKLRGIAWVELHDGCLIQVELHWYEAHGKGKREIKIKRVVG